MYQTILWAHDASDRAEQARPHVIAVADAFKSTVLICHVVEVTESVGGGDVSVAQGVTYSTRLEAAAHELREAGLPHVETVVLQGVVDQALATLAIEREVDLIVTSTRARGLLARAVLGSVSESLVRNTPGIPVFVVHGAED
ncbi:MAG: universal stress protein [Dehalococcoidia bacterium]|nr:universal stress protein [Dehalococcoidia bacterium]